MQKKAISKNTKGLGVKNTVKAVVIGAGVAGLAAGAYFFFGPKGKMHQKHAKAWAIKMKAEVIEKLESAREMSQPVYNNIIDTVAKQYAKGAKVGKAEIMDLATDLKKHWKAVSRTTKTAKAKGSKKA